MWEGINEIVVGESGFIALCCTAPGGIQLIALLPRRHAAPPHWTIDTALPNVMSTHAACAEMECIYLTANTI